MAKTRDPYYEWFGIPPKDQPPNHYRLLGLELFESNRKVIATAADRQMSFVKTYQCGEDSDLTQKILNQLSAARLCLLNPTRKAEYDRQLQDQLDRVLATEDTVEGEVVECRPVETLPSPVLPPLTLTSPPVPDHTPPRTMIIASCVVIGCLLAGVVVGIVLLQLLGGDEPISERVAQQSTGSRSDDGNAAVPADVRDEAAATPETLDSGQTVPEDTLDQTSPQVEHDSEIPPATVPAVEDTVAPLEPESESHVGSDSEPDGMTEPDTDQADDTDAAQTPLVRIPVPDSDVQKRITEEISEFYDIDTNSVAKKKKVCEELFDLSRDPKEGPERRFVLLRLVSQMAGEIGDCSTMFQAVDEIGLTYDLQTSAVKARLLMQMLGSADDAAKVMVFLRNYDCVLVNLLEDDDYDLASQLSVAARGLCERPIGSKEFRQGIIDRHTRFAALKQEREQVKSAFDTLAANTQDADANVTAGRWLCFVKGDWERGLPYLAGGNDENLRAAAIRDLQSSADNVVEQISLADSWWDLAQQADTEQKPGLLLRAGYWYAQVDVESLAGIDRVKVESRIAEIDRQTNRVSWTGLASTEDRHSESSADREFAATSSDVAELFSRGLSAALQDRDFELADRLFDRCVDMNANHIPALNNHALTSFRCGNTRQALHRLESAVELAPQSKELASNISLLSRLAGKDRLTLDHSNRSRLDALQAKTGTTTPYRAERGFVYMPFDSSTTTSSQLIDCACLQCNGLGHVPCPTRGCARGTVGTTTREVSTNPANGHTIIKTRPIRVPCKQCRGRGTIDCPYCSNGTMSRLD